jgi:hypothetical protein
MFCMKRVTSLAGVLLSRSYVRIWGSGQTNRVVAVDRLTEVMRARI